LQPGMSAEPEIHITGNEYRNAEQEESLPVFTPETIGLTPAQEAPDIGDRQKKIIDYVTDDSLFGEAKKKPSEGYGLDGTPAPARGKGLSPFDRKEAEPARVEKAYRFPSIELLKKPAFNKDTTEKSVLHDRAKVLEETLHSFGVSASVLNVVKGPAVTRYEIQPSAGVKVASIVRLADDIALNLKAKSIRIEAPIPGKAAVGIEVENEAVNMVVLREILESREFKTHKSKIALAIGKGISGDCIVSDLKDMPHLLIAGATGSGKSVCINSLIVSLLYRASPQEVRLVLIDPKVVELGNYNGIPHLLIPVVTEPPKAAAALGWAVSEMTDRYKKFAEEGVRDLVSYNESVKTKGEDELVLPQIVIVIDELADLMMVAPSQVEECICRLAQMARAAGMHLIVATQRPSVDVITGVIKANIPSRIAFAVSSQFDSRTILDMGGAEKLVGKGDMLFSPQGMGKPMRVQGCFISDSEVHAVIDFLEKSAPKPEYSGEIITAIDRAGMGSGRMDDDNDELLTDAIETVVRAEQASVSMLQRRFRIGYNRAARLVDLMEERGIIGPSDGSRPRKVMMTLDQFLQLEKQSK
jgi:DNA segregation ATPase FtsK/SpoIIIE, S-DNA-T family